MSFPGSTSAPAELFRALALLAELPGAGHARVAHALGLGAVPDEAAYADLFLFQLPPHASVYVGVEGMMGGEARGRIAGFWRAVGRTPPPEPDHLSALLGLYAALLDEAVEASPAQAILVRRAAAALLHEHLAPWLPFFLERAREVAGGFYGAWTDVLVLALRAQLASVPPPDALPLHLRVAPALPDPRTEGAEAFLSGLLAPVRCGMILTRGDVADLGRTLSIGVRMGSRKSVLEQMVAERPEAVLDALGRTAAEWARRHGAWGPYLGGIARFWARRAEGTAALLRELAVPGTGVGAGDPAGVTS